MPPTVITWPVALLAGVVSGLPPRDRSEVWEWAERNVRLPAEVTPYPGPWRLSRTPYGGGEWSPLWAHRRYQQVDNVWAAQTGKTLMMYLTLLYDVATDPGPVMLVYPDQKTAQRRSRHHVQPLIRECLPSHLTGVEDDFSALEYRLRSCAVMLGWAGSPSVLSGEPIKHLKLDEEAKYPGGSDTEADPKRLALRRLVAYGAFGNSFGCTTPSLAGAPGWRDWSHSTRCQFYVPCPKCGAAQVMYFRHDVDRRWFVTDPDAREWRGGVKWDRDEQLTREQRCESAYYECEACGAHWTDADRVAAVARGQWRAGNPDAGRYASHLASWCAPWVRLSHVVGRWFDCYRDPDARHDFLNSDCAVPYEEEGKSADPVKLRGRILPGHHRGQVPDGASFLFLTADVHDDHIRYRVRAWAYDLTSWGVEEGPTVPDLAILDQILARTWRTSVGAVLPIARAIVDARWRTDEVYQLALRHPGVVYPVMGMSQRELWKPTKQYVTADPGKGLYLAGAVDVVLIDDGRWKDLLFARWDIPTGSPGAWYVEEEASEEYWRQLAGEVKIVKTNTLGKESAAWKQTGPNHALDVEKYQIIAADVFQLAALGATVQPVAQPHPAKADDGVNPYTGRTVGR